MTYNANVSNLSVADQVTFGEINQMFIDALALYRKFVVDARTRMNMHEASFRTLGRPQVCPWLVQSLVLQLTHEA